MALSILIFCTTGSGILLLISAQQATQKIHADHEQLQKITNKVKQTEKLLESAKGKKSNTLRQIELLNSQISYRNELLDVLKSNLEKNNKDLSESLRIIEENRINVQNTQKLYVDFLKKKLLHKITFNPVLSLLHQENLEHQVKRWYLLQWLEKNLLQTMTTLDSSYQMLVFRQEELNAKTKVQKALVEVSQDENKCLLEDMVALQGMKKELENLEGHLYKDLISYKTKKEEAARIISGNIRDLDHKSTKSSRNNEILKLNFPVNFPIITSRFGKNIESGNPNLVLRNNGIDIQSTGPFVKSAADAKVIQIRRLPSSDYLLITKTGNYYLVYSNLQSVLLKEGELLNKGTTLGKSSPNESGAYELHFEVWEGSKPTDPLKFMVDH
ncbi:MAG: peptidoglycan DD-metalloendopeptidase family protein [Saprospiraceae bacterium]|nr:peptidoglycan DD-metalloendopeptidase family protein [Saprospiraceae bacterium]